MSATHALVIAEPDTILTFGAGTWRLPEPMMRLVRGLVAGAPGLQAVAGNLAGDVVRLTTGSKMLLAEHGALIGKEGAILGVVQDAGGKFAGVLGFEPVSHVAQLAGGLPVLLGAMALQAQLVAIERKLDHIQADVDLLIRDGHIAVLAEARAALTILEDVHGDVLATGQLTDADWERLVPIELKVRALHEEAGAHLRDLDRILAGVDGGMGARLHALRRAARHDQAGFWLKTYMLAETALARWEFLRLVRLATEDDPKLAREVDEVEDSLIDRRRFAVELSRKLSAYLADAGRVDGLLQRIRIIARAHIEQLILDLDTMLVAYREWLPDDTIDQPSALPEAVLGALAPSSAEPDEWESIVARARKHSGSLVTRGGELAERAGSTVARAARVTAHRAGDLADDALERLRGSDAAADEDDDSQG